MYRVIYVFIIYFPLWVNTIYWNTLVLYLLSKELGHFVMMFVLSSIIQLLYNFLIENSRSFPVWTGDIVSIILFLFCIHFTYFYVIPFLKIYQNNLLIHEDTYLLSTLRYPFDKRKCPFKSFERGIFTYIYLTKNYILIVNLFRM